MISDIHNVLQTELDGKAVSFGSQHCKIIMHIGAENGQNLKQFFEKNA